MDIKYFESEILRFLSSSEPQVVCITGQWGVGKTFLWNYLLKKAQEEKSVVCEKYSYISLFGINNIDEFKSAIVENTVDSKVVNLKPDWKSYSKNIESVSVTLGEIDVKKAKSTATWMLKWLSKKADYVPYLSSYSKSIQRALLHTIADQIICVDDLERAGSSLDVKNVLGVVSMLRHEKNCKIVLLLNQEALVGESSKEFNRQLEKVADQTLSYEPSAAYSARIALESKEKMSLHPHLSECVEKLNIVNIRVIKKTEAYCRRIFEILSGFDDRILRQSIHTATLGCYIKFQPDIAPPMHLIRDFNKFANLYGDGKAGDPKITKFQQLLNSYEFGSVDEFDQVVLNGIECGYFDSDELKNKAENKQIYLLDNDVSREISDSWSEYYNSFNSDQNLALSRIFDTNYKHVQFVGPSDLNVVIRFLRKYGWNTKASELISRYVSMRNDNFEFLGHQ